MNNEAEKCFSDNQSNLSVPMLALNEEKQKARVKKRTFSINSSALMPAANHGRKLSKLPGEASYSLHNKNSLSVVGPPAFFDSSTSQAA